MAKPNFIKTAVIAGLPFGIIWGGFMRFTMGPQFNFGVAAVAGLLFGLAMSGFSQIMSRRMEGNRSLIVLEPGETLQHEGPANHWLGIEARGGWLYLTNRRLVFRSHKMNVQNTPLDLTRTEIEGIEFKNTLGIIQNGLVVRLRHGDPQTFVVGDRTKWKEEIGRV